MKFEDEQKVSVHLQLIYVTNAQKHLDKANKLTHELPNNKKQNMINKIVSELKEAEKIYKFLLAKTKSNTWKAKILDVESRINVFERGNVLLAISELRDIKDYEKAAEQLAPSFKGDLPTTMKFLELAKLAGIMNNLKNHP